MDVVAAIAALVGSFFLLDVGADSFTDTDAIGDVARRLNASEGIVGLLTAGGEWEELVVVVLALAGGHQALAVGNIIGSCIANLTGSMPLGLVGPRPLVLEAPSSSSPPPRTWLRMREPGFPLTTPGRSRAWPV